MSGTNLKPKLVLLIILTILVVIKESWPEAKNPRGKDDTVLYWTPADPSVKKHPNQSWKQYWEQKYSKAPSLWAVVD